MAKNIMKELIIILLLALAIILLLGVILYDYVPSNKIVPEKVSYSPPEEIKQELENIIADSSYEEPQTYTIEAEDLSNYKKIQEYVPGRKNPFASTNTEIDNNTVTDNANGTNTNTQSTSDTQTTTEKQENSTLTENTGYIPNKGTK